MSKYRKPTPTTGGSQLDRDMDKPQPLPTDDRLPATDWAGDEQSAATIKRYENSP